MNTRSLVKDEVGLLPLSPARHRRVLLVVEVDRRNVNGPLPPLQVGRLLREEGSSVEDYTTETPVGTDWFDVLIYAVGGEGTFLGTSLEIGWERLHGELFRSMARFWHELPTIFISFGTPYRIREVPGCPVIINAYSPVLPMQEAAVRALVGQTSFAGVSPVDLTVAARVERAPARPGAGNATVGAEWLKAAHEFTSIDTNGDDSRNWHHHRTRPRQCTRLFRFRFVLIRGPKHLTGSFITSPRPSRFPTFSAS